MVCVVGAHFAQVLGVLGQRLVKISPLENVISDYIPGK